MPCHQERPHILEANEKQYKNWLCSERSKSRHCSSVAEVAYLRESCVVSFLGNIGEICLPCNIKRFSTASCLKDWIFVSKGLLRQTERKIMESFICIGCKNCGCPMEQENKRYRLSVLLVLSQVKEHLIQWVLLCL